MGVGMAWVRRHGGLVVVAPLLVSVVSAQSVTAPTFPIYSEVGSRKQRPANADLPDSPGVAVAKLTPSPLFPIQSSTQNTNQAGSSTPPAPQAQPTVPVTQTSQKPVGTAAAEPTHANGIAASQPAGVAIAPGKQHRVRTIVIATGAIIGAGVAIGLVAALTAGTSSRPPGAH
jgi:hypothetical protein